MIVTSTTHGACMGPEWQHALVSIDTDAPIHSGAVVQLWLRYDDGTTSRIIKYLEYCPLGESFIGTPGRWYGRCDDGVFLIDPRSVVPDRIYKVVRRERREGAPTTERVEKAADEATRRYYENQTRDARAYWAEHGYPQGVPFPGLDAVVGARPVSRRVAS